VTVTPAVEYQRSGDSVGIRPTEPEDYARLLGEIAESAPDRLRVVHGWAVGTSPDGLDELGAARRWLELGFHSALAAMQACASMMASGTAVDVCILSSDMQDVAGDGDIEPAKAAVIGLVKHGPKEFENLACRSVDITLRDGASGPAAAGLLYAELTATPGHEQVAYRGRKRWTWSYDSITLDPAAGVPPTLKVGGVYLITGGLGGLGLALARQLAELAGARLVLISRAGLPGRGQWDVLAAAGPGDVVAERILAIRELEALGAEVLVCAADVTDEKEMRGVRAAVQERFGGVDGVFHLAAIAGGGMLESRTRAAAEQVFAPKVYGCYVLDAVFGGDVDLMVLYSSITVLTADFGLGDYTGANAVMDAFAQRRWAAGRRVLSINWPAWAEVGMAAGLHRPKILQRMREPGYSTDVSHPLFSGRSGQADRVATFYVDASAAQWVLAEHRFSGCPTMPASGFVELMRAAFEELAGNPRAEISNLVFPQLLMENKDEDVRLQATATGDGGYDIVVSGFSAGRDPVEYARCHVSAAEPGEPPRHDLAAVRAQCLAETTPARGPIGSLTLGPRWDNLTARSSGPDLEVLDLELPAVFAADLESYYLHPALLDSATALGYYLLPALLDGAAAGGQSKAEEDGDGPAGVSDDTGPAGGTLADVMPFGYDRLAVRGPLPVRCQAVIRKRLGGSSDVVQYDIVLTDADGIELVAIDGFTMVRTRDVADITGGEAGQIASRPSTANRAKSDVGALFDPSRAEAGVFPGEASEVLHRILAHADVPQVIWCPLGLAEGVRRAGKVTRASLVERATAAPVGSSLTRDLDTPYVEAATETERVLARLWQEALGIAQVGAEDDFFDLAGNSLIAVQLVARIGQRFGVDITVAQLFEGRSVRGLASCVEKALLARVDSMTEGEALEALRRLDAAG
jgi:NAD(P)-dependent dehydrogenase (short-subunit alcohol dehydrogenase family)/acyl carrier protein